MSRPLTPFETVMLRAEVDPCFARTLAHWPGGPHLDLDLDLDLERDVAQDTAAAGA